MKINKCAFRAKTSTRHIRRSHNTEVCSEKAPLSHTLVPIEGERVADVHGECGKWSYM